MLLSGPVDQGCCSNRNSWHLWHSIPKEKEIYWSDFLSTLPLSPECSILVPARPPSQPNPPKISNRTKNALTLRWNAPQDNGSPITLYELKWDQCRGDWEQLMSDKVKQFKLTYKFPPGSSAQFIVRAINSVGAR